MTKKQILKCMENDLRVAKFTRDRAAKLESEGRDGKDVWMEWSGSLSEIRLLEKYIDLLR